MNDPDTAAAINFKATTTATVLTDRPTTVLCHHTSAS
jgi:hypothetical protein